MTEFKKWFAANPYFTDVVDMDFTDSEIVVLGGISKKFWRRVNLSGCDFGHVQNAWSTFTDCNFTGAKLNYAGFRNCHFENCDFTKASMRFAAFTGAKFIDCVGLPTTEEMLRDFCIEEDANFWYAYKAFGVWHDPPSNWDIAIGSHITNRVDADRTKTCSYGINVGSKQWGLENIYAGGYHLDRDVWRVRIPKDTVIIVPYGSDGKFRVSECYLERIVKW